MQLPIPNFYERKDYKRLIAIPTLLVVLSLLALPHVPAGIDLKGGQLLTAQTEGSADLKALEAALAAELDVRDVSARQYATPAGNGIEIETEQNAGIAEAELLLKGIFAKRDALTAAELDAQRLADELERTVDAAKRGELQAQLSAANQTVARLGADVAADAERIIAASEPFVGAIDTSKAADARELVALADTSFSAVKAAYRQKLLSVVSKYAKVREGTFSVREVGPSLSAFFLNRAQNVVLYAFILSAIVVFVIFRSLIPSLIVILGAMSDMIIALGAMSLFQIPLTLATLAALLMMMGYSLDTDVLLSIRLLKRSEGTARQRAFDTMKTGFTMSIAAIAAFAALFALAFATQIATYYQIAVVAIFGLFADIIATWLTNAVLMLWYLEGRKEAHHG